jgi:hypothetical protein
MLMIKDPARAQPFRVLGNPLVSSEHRWSVMTRESSATTFTARLTVRLRISARVDAASQCDCDTAVLNV